jgi:hypothetical protein
MIGLRGKAVRGASNPTLQPHQAGMPEEVRPNFTVFEVGKKDAIDAPFQQPRQVVLAEM